NAGMTSLPKKRRRTERRLTDHLLTEHGLTEQRNAASKNLDRMTSVEIVRLMNREDRKVAAAVGREIPAIARAVDAIVRGMRNGGRLIDVGAGASGRMAKIVIELEVGAEVLTGSRRLKAGTSQKMVLNMLSTAVVARLGHVYENLIIDAVLTNDELWERALRILAEASGKKVSAAEHG